MRAMSATYGRIVAGVIVAAIVLTILWLFADVVAYIVVSAVLAVVGRPLVRLLVGVNLGKRHIPRSVAALITLVVIWIVFTIFCAIFVPMVLNKVYQLGQLDFRTVISGIEGPVMQLQDYLYELFSVTEQEFSVSDSLVASMSQLIDAHAIRQMFQSIVGVLFSSVISILSISFITFFFLRDEGLFYSMILAMSPTRYTENIRHVLDSATVLLHRYFSGILAESTMLMVAVIVIMKFIGMEWVDASFIGLIMAVMNVVPYAGPFVGGIISVFVGIVNPIDGMTAGMTALVIMGVLLVLKGFDDFVVQPTLFSERVKAHPLEIFIVILMAASLAGIWGMLLAIPSYTVIRVFAKEFFSQFSLVRKLTDKI